MSSASRNSNESEGTFLKTLLQHEAQLKERDALFPLMQDDLKRVKDGYTKSKKSSHTSSARGKESYGEQSLKINEYYQPPPKRVRKEKKETRREVMVDLPHFHGKENVEIYLDWEMKIEKSFACPLCF